MKNYYLNAPQQTSVSDLDSLFAELILENALRNFQKEKILEEIDQSLRNNNKSAFLSLTEKLKKLHE